MSKYNGNDLDSLSLLPLLLPVKAKLHVVSGEIYLEFVKKSLQYLEQLHNVLGLNLIGCVPSSHSVNQESQNELRKENDAIITDKLISSVCSTQNGRLLVNNFVNNMVKPFPVFCEQGTQTDFKSNDTPYKSAAGGCINAKSLWLASNNYDSQTNGFAPFVYNHDKNADTQACDVSNKFCDEISKLSTTTDCIMSISNENNEEDDVYTPLLKDQGIETIHCQDAKRGKSCMNGKNRRENCCLLKESPRRGNHVDVSEGNASDHIGSNHQSNYEQEMQAFKSYTRTNGLKFDSTFETNSVGVPVQVTLTNEENAVLSNCVGHQMGCSANVAPPSSYHCHVNNVNSRLLHWSTDTGSRRHSFEVTNRSNSIPHSASTNCLPLSGVKNVSISMMQQTHPDQCLSQDRKVKATEI